MKYISGIMSIALLASCSNSHNSGADLAKKQQEQIDSQKVRTELVKPGLGELMTNIQGHHAKLWYAGNAENWKLAQFEIDELKETFQKCQNIEGDREEVKNVRLIFPPIDAMTRSVTAKNKTSFVSAFNDLTTTCNRCHEISKFEFISIKTPTEPPVTNQEFKAVK